MRNTLSSLSRQIKKQLRYLWNLPCFPLSGFHSHIAVTEKDVCFHSNFPHEKQTIKITQTCLPKSDVIVCSNKYSSTILAIIISTLATRSNLSLKSCHSLWILYQVCKFLIKFCAKNCLKLYLKSIQFHVTAYNKHQKYFLKFNFRPVF